MHDSIDDFFPVSHLVAQAKKQREYDLSTPEGMVDYARGMVQETRKKARGGGEDITALEVLADFYRCVIERFGKQADQPSGISFTGVAASATVHVFIDTFLDYGPLRENVLKENELRKQESTSR